MHISIVADILNQELSTGFVLVNLDLLRFWAILEEELQIYMEIGAQEQYNLIDTIFKYIFDFGSPGKYL